MVGPCHAVRGESDAEDLFSEKVRTDGTDYGFYFGEFGQSVSFTVAVGCGAGERCGLALS